MREERQCPTQASPHVELQCEEQQQQLPRDLQVVMVAVVMLAYLADWTLHSWQRHSRRRRWTWSATKSNGLVLCAKMNVGVGRKVICDLCDVTTLPGRFELALRSSTDTQPNHTRHTGKIHNIHDVVSPQQKRRCSKGS